MKYLMLILLLVSVRGYSQTTYFIRADSTKLQKVGGNNEFILQNSTRVRTGAYLKNISNGITGFFYAIDSAWMATDSTLVVRRGDGNDTLLIRGSGISTTPGIDDVLAVGQVLTADRTIDLSLSTPLTFVGNNTGFIEFDFLKSFNMVVDDGTQPQMRFRMFDGGDAGAAYTELSQTPQITTAAEVGLFMYHPKYIGPPTGRIGLVASKTAPAQNNRLDLGGTNFLVLFDTTIMNLKSGGTGTFLLKGLTAGASTDSVLVRRASDGNVGYRNAADFGGGSTFYNSNVGSGYRWAIPNSNNIKTFTASNGLTLDSATSNQIGIKQGGSIIENTAITNAGQFTYTLQLDEDDDEVGFIGTDYNGLIGFKNGSATIRESSGGGSSTLQVGIGNSNFVSTDAGASSEFWVRGGQIELNPHLGKLTIDTLSAFADTTNFKPLVINTTGTAGTQTQVYRATYWPTGAGGGSGTVNSGVANHLTYYPSTGTTVDDISGVTYDGTAFTSTGSTSANRTFFIENTDGSGRAAIQMGTDLSALNGFFFANGSTKTDYAGAGSVNFMNLTANPLGFITNNTLRMTVTGAGNLMLGGFTDPASAVYAFGITNGVAPSASITNGIITYAEDVAASSEYKVRDEAGNITVLSPHHFTRIGKRSEPLAWAHYSERDGKFISADMTKALRTIEIQSAEIEQLKKDVAELKGLIYQMKEPVKLVITGDVKDKEVNPTNQ